MRQENRHEYIMRIRKKKVCALIRDDFVIPLHIKKIKVHQYFDIFVQICKGIPKVAAFNTLCSSPSRRRLI